MASHPKIAGAMTLVIALCLVLCGCSAPLLSQREVVRGVFFSKDGQEYTAVLLLADQQGAESGGDAYRTAEGRAPVPDAALRAAEETLDGSVFYGLTDLAVLPTECDWEELTGLGHLLYERAQPAPRITLFSLAGEQTPLSERAESLYRVMHDAQRRYGIENGLPSLFAQQTECALPVWQGTGYGFGFWQKGRPTALYTDKLSAQLAAVLCGQADRLDAGYAEGKAEVEAAASVRCEVDSNGQTTLHLSLRSVRVWDLNKEKRGEEELLETLFRELEQNFERLAAHVQTGGYDPLHLSIWQFARTGNIDAGMPRLVVSAEK